MVFRTIERASKALSEQALTLSRGANGWASLGRVGCAPRWVPLHATPEMLSYSVVMHEGQRVLSPILQ